MTYLERDAEGFIVREEFISDEQYREYRHRAESAKLAWSRRRGVVQIVSRWDKHRDSTTGRYVCFECDTYEGATASALALHIKFGHRRLPTPEQAAGEAHAMAVLLGRRGGLKGGPERARRLSPERRTEIARKAAMKRWGSGLDE